MVFTDLHNRVNHLWQGEVDLTQRDYSPISTNKLFALEELYLRLTDMQRGPFAKLGLDLPSPELDEKGEYKFDDEKTYQTVGPKVKYEDNSPQSLFHTLFVRTVEHCLEEKDAPEYSRINSAVIYGNGIIQIKATDGFFVIYNPPGEKSAENLVLIVPLAKNNSSETQDYDESAIYVYNPNVTVDERLAAYKIRRTIIRADENPVYEDKAIDEWSAKSILKILRDRMDKRPGTLSSFQTVLH